MPFFKKKFSMNPTAAASSSSTRKKKVVTFTEDEPQVHHVELDDNLKDLLWYNKHDFSFFQRRDRRMIVLIKHGRMDPCVVELKSKSKESPRGLERVSEPEQTAYARRNRRGESIACVLFQQMVFYNLETDGTDIIAEAYRNSPGFDVATQEAIEWATLDERFVKDHVQNSITMSTSNCFGRNIIDLNTTIPKMAATKHRSGKQRSTRPTLTRRS